MKNTVKFELFTLDREILNKFFSMVENCDCKNVGYSHNSYNSVIVNFADKDTCYEVVTSHFINIFLQKVVTSKNYIELQAKTPIKFPSHRLRLRPITLDKQVVYRQLAIKYN